MNKHNHLLCFDLTSYGAALTLLNQFADGDNIIDFEISPCGPQAQLLLVANDLIALKLAQSEALSLLSSQILDSCLIENLHADVLPTYLSQNKTPALKSLAIFEGGSTSRGLELLQNLLLKNISVIDFRIVRTVPKNVILIATAENVNVLVDVNCLGIKKNIIENKQTILNNYF